AFSNARDRLHAGQAPKSARPFRRRPQAPRPSLCPARSPAGKRKPVAPRRVKSLSLRQRGEHIGAMTTLDDRNAVPAPAMPRRPPRPLSLVQILRTRGANSLSLCDEALVEEL